MTYLTLVYATISRRKSQVVLAFLAISVAFLLLGLMLSVRQAFVQGGTLASAHRLRTNAANAQLGPIPLGFVQRIASVPGVQSVMYASGMAAAYQDNPSNMLLQAVPPAIFLRTFPELDVSRGEKDAFEHDRQALLVGPDALKQYGWKVGQQIGLRTNVIDKEGATTWYFHVVGTYSSAVASIPKNLIFMNYDYLNQQRASGKDQALGFVEVIDSPGHAVSIASKIDRIFKTSSPRLHTSPEDLIVQQQLARYGAIDQLVVIVGLLVFLCMLLLAHNVWYERVQLGRRDFAIMKAMGVSSLNIGLIIVYSALILTLCAALCGIVAAYALTLLLASHVEQVLAGFRFPMGALLVCGMVALFFSLLSSVFPAYLAGTTNLNTLKRD